MFDYNQTAELGRGKFIQLDNMLEPASPMFFGFDIEEQFAEVLSQLTHRTPFDKLFLLTDSFIFDFFGDSFFFKLKKKYPDTKLYLLPRGEMCKTFSVLQKLCDQLIEKGVTKSSVLIAFGGGSIGNITGLAAGLIFRGIRFIEAPTTLSHQTDGMLSNKQAVNGKYGKNHFGLFHAPIFSWADTQYPGSESIRFKKSGIVEGIKNALIDQKEFIQYLETSIKSNSDYSSQQLTDLSFKLIISKLSILKKDPTEKNYGIILEYGHTFAHAIEWLSEGALTHGEAVSIGMKIAAELSAFLGYIDVRTLEIHYRLIDDVLGLKPKLREDFEPGAILETMYADNKKTGKDVKYVLLEKIGQCKKGSGDYLISVDKEIVKHVIETFFQNY